MRDRLLLIQMIGSQTAVHDSNESLGSVTNPTMFFPYFHLWMQKIFFRVYYINGSSEVYILS